MTEERDWWTEALIAMDMRFDLIWNNALREHLPDMTDTDHIWDYLWDTIGEDNV